MELSSLFFGDIADLFQDDRLEDIKRLAGDARNTASYAARSSKQSLDQITQRLKELEDDNALLALVILRLLKALDEKGAVNTEAMAAEIRTAMSGAKQGAPPFHLFREALGLPPNLSPNWGAKNHSPLSRKPRSRWLALQKERFRSPRPHRRRDKSASRNISLPCIALPQRGNPITLPPDGAEQMKGARTLLSASYRQAPKSH